jgi:hypothetical protein
MAAAGLAPFAAGRAFPRDGGGALPCPFREATGIPCPLCGATRGFALATRGDLVFLQYNAVAVAGAALLVVGSLLGVLLAAVRPASARRLAAELGRGRTLLGLALVGAALAWAWTLTHAASITDT